MTTQLNTANIIPSKEVKAEDIKHIASSQVAAVKHAEKENTNKTTITLKTAHTTKKSKASGDTSNDLPIIKNALIGNILEAACTSLIQAISLSENVVTAFTQLNTEILNGQVTDEGNLEKKYMHIMKDYIGQLNNKSQKQKTQGQVNLYQQKVSAAKTAGDNWRSLASELTQIAQQISQGLQQLSSNFVGWLTLIKAYSGSP